MRPARPWLALALAVLLFALPLAPARAYGDDTTSESRVGVMLMVVCGLALKAAIPTPVPWAGIAVVSCFMGLLDAALSPDDPPADSPPAPSPTP